MNKNTSTMNYSRIKTNRWGTKSILLLMFIWYISISAIHPDSIHYLEETETPDDSHNATADELVYFTNLRRTQFGLPALSVNSILMASAQETANDMADSHLSSHIGGVSYRLSQAGYGSGVTVWATENIANGTDIPAEELVYVIWNDDTHNIPVMNPIYCDIGAGVATDSEGISYYVIHAAYTEKRYCGEYRAPDGTTLETIYADQWNSGDHSGTQEAAEVSQYMQPVNRVTPNVDDQIIHEVSYGQTLWSIAITYGTKIKEIQELNGMAEDNQTVYVGQELLIPTSLTPHAIIAKTSTPTPEKTSSTIDLTQQNSTYPIHTTPTTNSLVETQELNKNSASFSTILFWIAVGGLLLILFGVLSRYMPSENS